MDQGVGHASLRALQVRVHHAREDEAILGVGEARNVGTRSTKVMVRRCFSHSHGALRRVVALRARREIGRGGATRLGRLALLDQTDRRRDRLDRRFGIYVHSVQSVHHALPAMACVQQSHFHTERSRESGASPIPDGFASRGDDTAKGSDRLDAGAQSHSAAPELRSSMCLTNGQTGLHRTTAEARAQTLRIRQVDVRG